MGVMSQGKKSPELPSWAGVLFGLLCQGFVIFYGTGEWANDIAPSGNTGQHLLASYCIQDNRLIPDLTELPQ